jgi:hypothetical protein
MVEKGRQKRRWPQKVDKETYKHFLLDRISEKRSSARQWLGDVSTYVTDYRRYVREKLISAGDAEEAVGDLRDFMLNGRVYFDQLEKLLGKASQLSDGQLTGAESVCQLRRKSGRKKSLLRNCKKKFFTPARGEKQESPNFPEDFFTDFRSAH